MFASKMFTILYYLGIVSCGIQGAEKVAPEKMELCFTSMVRVLVSVLLNSFGGGLIRDLLLWRPPRTSFSCIYTRCVSCNYFCFPLFIYCKKSSLMPYAF